MIDGLFDWLIGKWLVDCLIDGLYLEILFLPLFYLCYFMQYIFSFIETLIFSNFCPTTGIGDKTSPLSMCFCQISFTSAIVGSTTMDNPDVGSLIFFFLGVGSSPSAFRCYEMNHNQGLTKRSFLNVENCTIVVRLKVHLYHSKT